MTPKAVVKDIWYARSKMIPTMHVIRIHNTEPPKIRRYRIRTEIFMAHMARGRKISTKRKTMRTRWVISASRISQV